jgi:UDP-N-acetylmuramoyl-tripeptide--D-alanyl-D-alanine ligase
VKLGLDWIAQTIGARVQGTLPEITVSACGFDSRGLPPGALFFALRGEGDDGHRFVTAAFERGAVAAVVDHPLPAPGPLLVVDDTLRALQSLASAARQRFTGRVIGITGSAGKTTTKEAVAAVLGAALRIGKTTGNFNNHIGVPYSILHLPDDAEAAVLEIGMNHAGEIRNLAKIARPDIAVVTNVGTAHIENFESIEGIELAKRELVDALPADGIAVLNADDSRVREFAAVHPGRTILYGLSEEAEVRGVDVRYSETGSRFTLEGAGPVECPLPGRAGVLTALAAFATARACGLALPPLLGALAEMEPLRMRAQRLLHQGMTVWNDCYNSNPEAARMMVELLAATPALRRIAVLGEMLELGHWSKVLHEEVGKYAASCGISVLVGIRGAARNLVDAARIAGLAADAAYFFEDPRSAGLFLKSFAREGDALLFKGSRGTRVELALNAFLGLDGDA